MTARSFFILILVTGITQPATAGGWPQDKGSLFFKLSEWWIDANSFFDDNGNKQSTILQYGYYSTSFYGEYGFTPRLTGILHFPFLNHAYAVPPSGTGRQILWAAGDVDLACKYALSHQKKIAFSATLSIGIPLGKDNKNSANGLQTGDGEFNQLMRLDAGTNYRLLRSDARANIYGGFNHRTEMFAHELLYGFATWINISKGQITLTARFDGIQPVRQSTNPLHVNPQNLFSNDREYLRFSPEAIYHINDHWGITAGISTTIFGRNIFANTAYTVGFFYKRSPDINGKEIGLYYYSM